MYSSTTWQVRFPNLVFPCTLQAYLQFLRRNQTIYCGSHTWTLYKLELSWAPDWWSLCRYFLEAAQVVSVLVILPIYPFLFRKPHWAQSGMFHIRVCFWFSKMINLSFRDLALTLIGSFSLSRRVVSWFLRDEVLFHRRIQKQLSTV